MDILTRFVRMGAGEKLLHLLSVFFGGGVGNLTEGLVRGCGSKHVPLGIPIALGFL